MLNKNFNIKQLGEKKVLDLYLYGEIQEDYIDYWTGEKVESTTSADYVQKVINEAGSVAEINVYINSCGGSVMEGVAIYNILKRSGAFVTVYIDAFAYSVASVIAMVGDKVVMPSNATMFIHNAWIETWGNSSKLRKDADDLDVINESTKANYLHKAGEKLSKDVLDELMDKETFLNAETALKYSLCDEIANPVELTSESEEVAKQALRSGNKKGAKQAMKQIAEQRKSPPAPPSGSRPKNKKPKKDFYEKVLEILKTK